MPKYRVFKPFPAKQPLVRGQVLIDPKFKNLNTLVRNGFLKLVPDADAAAAAESSGARSPIIESPAEEPVEQAAASETPALARRIEGDSETWTDITAEVSSTDEVKSPAAETRTKKTSKNPAAVRNPKNSKSKK